MSFFLNKKRGGAGADLLIVVGIFIVVWVIWMLTGGPERAKQGGGLFTQPTTPSLTAPTEDTGLTGSKVGTDNQKVSVSKGSVFLRRGSDSYEYYPMKEYVTLEASYNNSGPVTVSGWKFKNRGWTTGQAVTAVIPKGTKTFKSNYQPVNELIKLNPGDRAIVTTGRVVTEVPFAIKTSFQVNKCSGYLQNEGHFQFFPPIYSNCPQPSKEVGADNLEKDCYDFLRNLGQCQTVKFDQYNRLEYIGTRNVLKDESFKPLTGACQQFMKTRLNYDSCVDNHKKDKDFLTKEWRIFLFKAQELWAANRETISLYDSANRLIDSLSY